MIRSEVSKGVPQWSCCGWQSRKWHTINTLVMAVALNYFIFFKPTVAKIPVTLLCVVDEHSELLVAVYPFQIMSAGCPPLARLVWH